MALSLSFYGGVEEIGGNKILLEDGDTHLFLDFGTSFDRRYYYFEEYLKPRPGAGMLDLLEMRLLPVLRGVYRDDLAPEDILSLFEPRREVKVDGVLLSHAHLDHSGYISFLREDIPVYTTAMTAFIAKAVQDSAPLDIEKEVCYSNPRALREGYRTPEKSLRQRPFCFLDCLSLPPAAHEFWDESPMKTKKLDLCPAPSDGSRVGSLPLRYFPVDHSIPGACSFAVETSVGWLCYTGDLRLHGRKGGLTERAVEEMSALHPHILICEGTRAGEEGGASEDEVYSTALGYVRDAAGKLVIADFGPRNVDRLLIFGDIARDTRRRLVILAKDAYLLDAVRLVSDEVPELGSAPDIVIYSDLKAMPGSWERKIREERYAGKMVDASEIHAHPGDYILCFSFWDLKNLIDIKPEGGLYIFSTSEAHNEEQQLDVWRLSNWIQHFGLTARGLPRGEPKSKGEGWEIPPDEMGLHASGHAGGEDLLSIVRDIAPKVLIPVHSLAPNFYLRELQGVGIEVKLPERDGTMRF